MWAAWQKDWPPHHLLGQVLDRIGAWCYAHGKHSLALLIINEDGKPSDGMFKRFHGLAEPVTSENYERQRVQLWQEDWSEVELPSAPEEVAEAHDRVGPAS
jgi:hypothetical protein